MGWVGETNRMVLGKLCLRIASATKCDIIQLGCVFENGIWCVDITVLLVSSLFAVSPFEKKKISFKNIVILLQFLMRCWRNFWSVSLLEHCLGNNAVLEYCDGVFNAVR